MLLGQYETVQDYYRERARIILLNRLAEERELRVRDAFTELRGRFYGAPGGSPH